MSIGGNIVNFPYNISFQIAISLEGPVFPGLPILWRNSRSKDQRKSVKNMAQICFAGDVQVEKYGTDMNDGHII
jgi:hypothetical protein